MWLSAESIICIYLAPRCNFPFKEWISALYLQIVKLITFNSEDVLKRQLVVPIVGRTHLGIFQVCLKTSGLKVLLFLSSYIFA